MKLFLNLLAVSSGGQITRAEAFLKRFPLVRPEVQLVVLKERDALLEIHPYTNVEIRSVRIAGQFQRGIRRVAWENSRMIRMLRREAPNAYLTFSHYLPIPEIGAPSIVGVSNLAPFSKEAWKQESMMGRARLALLQRTILQSARRAQKVIALSRACRKMLIAHGITENKIAVTPNGVDATWSVRQDDPNLSERIGIAKPFILYVSHFYRYKNHGRLVSAYMQLPRSLREQFQLVLVGKPSDEEYYRSIARQIADDQLQSDVVQIPGLRQEELRNLYQSAALFVFPSLIENSPNVLLEAMMAGAPVATSTLSPMPEFCDSAALYFDALSVDDIRNKMKVALLDHTLRQSLSSMSREQAKKYSWDTFVDQIAYQIDNLLL